MSEQMTQDIAKLVKRLNREADEREEGMRFERPITRELVALLREAALALTSTEALLRQAGEVLKPFAEHANLYDFSDGSVPKLEGHYIGGGITIGQVRAARSLASDIAKKIGAEE